ncbi:MAG: hypothetical protein KDK07_20915 [Bauldia sp.]|nr:hypothetical protein [Bauldia sp.]
MTHFASLCKIYTNKMYKMKLKQNRDDRVGRCRGAGVPCFNVEACNELMAATSVGRDLFEATIAADANGLCG